MNLQTLIMGLIGLVHKVMSLIQNDRVRGYKVKKMSFIWVAELFLTTIMLNN